MSRPFLVVCLFAAVVALGACQEQKMAQIASAPIPAHTYYGDVQPLILEKCAGCHNPDGIGPFSLLTLDDVTSHAAMMLPVVAARVMPPWPPSGSCNNSYAHDRSLTDEQLTTLTDWLGGDMASGDPAMAVTGGPMSGLSRVDQTMQMPVAYTPSLKPDDYRCFLLDWSPATATYVTGLGVRPGNAKIVHHAIAFVATPDQLAMYQHLDDDDAGPGWTCFGGPGIGYNAQWLGAWAPGTLGSDFPTGTGIPVAAGSKIVLQVHYNTANIATNAAITADQTQVDVALADTVDKPAVVQPFADPSWLKGNMAIPAGAPDTMYDFGIDITPYLGLLTGNVLVANQPVTIHSAGLHMHTRGTQIRGAINHADGSSECLVDIPAWNFNWQGAYGFTAPKTMNPGDQIYVQCHWNNTAANQPYVNGQQVAPTDVNWGETTEDEMCLEVLYLTQ